MATNVNLIRKLIVELFGSQMQASRDLDVAPRTVRYWCACGTASHVEKVLTALRAGEITRKTAQRILKDERARRVIHTIGEKKVSYKELISKAI